jgi:hypothetical protein
MIGRNYTLKVFSSYVPEKIGYRFEAGSLYGCVIKDGIYNAVAFQIRKSQNNPFARKKRIAAMPIFFHFGDIGVVVICLFLYAGKNIMMNRSDYAAFLSILVVASIIASAIIV